MCCYVLVVINFDDSAACGHFSMCRFMIERQVINYGIELLPCLDVGPTFVSSYFHVDFTTRQKPNETCPVGSVSCFHCDEFKT